MGGRRRHESDSHAEDEPRISDFIRKGLRSNGFTPTVVADGVSALDHAMSGEFDLLILDIGLPDARRLHRPRAASRLGQLDASSS